MWITGQSDNIGDLNNRTGRKNVEDMLTKLELLPKADVTPITKKTRGRPKKSV